MKFGRRQPSLGPMQPRVCRRRSVTCRFRGTFDRHRPNFVQHRPKFGRRYANCGGTVCTQTWSKVANLDDVNQIRSHPGQVPQNGRSRPESLPNGSCRRGSGRNLVLPARHAGTDPAVTFPHLPDLEHPRFRYFQACPKTSASHEHIGSSRSTTNLQVGSCGQPGGKLGVAAGRLGGRTAWCAETGGAQGPNRCHNLRGFGSPSFADAISINLVDSGQLRRNRAEIKLGSNMVELWSNTGQFGEDFD